MDLRERGSPEAYDDPTQFDDDTAFHALLPNLSERERSYVYRPDIRFRDRIHCACDEAASGSWFGKSSGSVSGIPATTKAFIQFKVAQSKVFRSAKAILHSGDSPARRTR